MNGFPSFTCPRCSAVSYNPNDFKHQYCGNCKMFMGTSTLFNRQGEPIDALTWGTLWEDMEYRVVAHDFAVPTPWEVKTVWEGVPTPGCMFSVGIRRVGSADWTTLAEPHTEAAAVTHHVRICNLLRAHAEKRLGDLQWE